jgi:pyruvate oxidase
MVKIVLRKHTISDVIITGLEKISTMAESMLYKHTVSEVIIEELEKWDVSFILGIPGGSTLGLIEAIRKKPTIKYIVVRHEENAAMAASAYNKLTGKIAACLTIAGPGTTNLATGLYDAKEDHASVLSLNGQVAEQYTNTGDTQETDQDAFFRPVTVFNTTITHKKDTIKVLTQAIKHAILDHGVAQVSIPNDIQKEPLDASVSDREHYLTKMGFLPDDSEIDKAVHLINQAKKPVVLTGWGAFGNSDVILRFAEKIKAPIITTFRAKGIIPEDNPWVLGILGNVGSPFTRKVVTDADLLITLGVGFSKLTGVPIEKKLVQVDIDPIKLGKQRFEIALWGDCKLVVPKILEKVNVKPENSTLKNLQEMKQTWFAQLEREADPQAVPIRPPYIMQTLSQIIPEDAIISIDVGDNAWWFGRNFIMKRQRLVMSGYHQAMGFGLPGAIAAKVAFPNKSVFCITGDGGFTMAMMDFITTIKYQLPIIVVILNNKQFAMIQTEQQIDGFPLYGNDLLNPDFARFAEACGGIGYTVKKPQNLSETLQKAINANCSTIVDIDTDPKRF